MMLLSGMPRRRMGRSISPVSRSICTPSHGHTPGHRCAHTHEKRQIVHAHACADTAWDMGAACAVRSPPSVCAYMHGATGGFRHHQRMASATHEQQRASVLWAPVHSAAEPCTIFGGGVCRSKQAARARARISQHSTA